MKDAKMTTASPEIGFIFEIKICLLLIIINFKLKVGMLDVFFVLRLAGERPKKFPTSF